MSEKAMARLRKGLGVVQVTSCANGELRVFPQWPGCKPYNDEDGGGPGLLLRLSAAKQLENIINGNAKRKKKG